MRDRLVEDVRGLRMGDVGDFSNFMGAVIDKNSFATQKEAIDEANASNGKASVLVGGGYDDSDGWFVEPTVIETSDPDFRTMREELFGPVVTAFVYDEKRYDETLDLIDAGAPYGLTGAVFSRDRAAVETAPERLRYAAGNFYVNDKPTGAVVGQQPFGGARASGTNDKAGSMWNLIRWVSPRTIKETFVPPTDYRYPFLQADWERGVLWLRLRLVLRLRPWASGLTGADGGTKRRRSPEPSAESDAGVAAPDWPPKLDRRRAPARVGDRPHMIVGGRRRSAELDRAEVRQLERQAVVVPKHRDGASAIHSADDVSRTEGVDCVVNVWPFVSSVTVSVAVVPSTLTSAEIVSPGATSTGTRTDTSGSTSYHAA